MVCQDIAPLRSDRDCFLHDLRTPLTVIRLRVQLLERDAALDWAQWFRHLDAIDAQVTVLARRLDEEHGRD